MDFRNKKVILGIAASLAALLLFTFQNCSPNLVTAVTATPVYACEKDVHAVDNLIRGSDGELKVTKNQMTGEPKAFFRKSAVDDEANYGANRTPRTISKNLVKKISKIKTYESAKTDVKKVTIENKKPARISASDDMKIRLKKIKIKKSDKAIEN